MIWQVQENVPQVLVARERTAHTFQRKEKQSSQRDGTAAKGVCCQVQRPELASHFHNLSLDFQACATVCITLTLLYKYTKNIPQKGFLGLHSELLAGLGYRFKTSKNKQNTKIPSSTH